MKPHNLLIVVAAFFVASYANAQDADIAANPSESEGVVYEAPAAFKPVEAIAATERAAVYPKTAELSNAFRDGMNVIDLRVVTPDRVVEAEQESARKFGHLDPGPKRVGLVRDIPEAAAASTSTAMLLDSRSDGQSVWTLAIRSPGAFGMRVHFTEFDAAEGTVLLYAYDREQLIVHGPYTGVGPNHSGDFWTPSLPGEEVYVEMAGAQMPRFVVSQIVHFDEDPGFEATDGTANSGGPLPCHLDVMCYGVSEAARQATGQMNIVVGNEVYVCTGTLLNDFDTETWVPYFLTANHCLATQSEADSLEVVWFYQKDSCDGTLPSYSTLPRTAGGLLLAGVSQSDGNDMSFLRLASDPPAGVAFAGWTTATSVNGFGIHHPAGSWKRTSIMSPVGVCPGCNCADGTDFDYYNMDDGLVEGGSSGSGIFNASGQLAGQLLGRCSNTTDPNDMTCDNLDSFWAMYGEFEETYPAISWWLHIGGTLHVDGAASPPGDGTAESPFTAIGLALNSAWPAARIKITAGYYSELLTINQNVRLVAYGGTVTIGG